MSMLSQPLVSVIVPLYNKEEWVARCIKSILQQTYQNIEVLVVNDGSTDSSRSVVAALDDSRVKIIDKPNGGVSSARNLGIDMAEGDYIAFIDADDRWELRHIEMLVHGFESYGNAVMVSNRLLERVSGDDEEIDRSDKVGIKCKYVEEDYLLSLSQNSFSIHIGSSMFVKSLLDEYSLRFFENIKMGEDINFMIRVSRFGQCIVSDYIGLIYYHDDENSPMNKIKKEASLTPLYFHGMDKEKWTDEESKKIIKFTIREYLKKAYQNRGLKWKHEEVLCHFSGGVKITKGFIPLYIAIRYTPNIIYVLYRKIKMIKNFEKEIKIEQ